MSNTHPHSFLARATHERTHTAPDRNYACNIVCGLPHCRPRGHVSNISAGRGGGQRARTLESIAGRVAARVCLACVSPPPRLQRASLSPELTLLYAHTHTLRIDPENVAGARQARALLRLREFILQKCGHETMTLTLCVCAHDVGGFQ